MRILNLCLTKNKTGCWKVRNQVPFEYLKRRGHKVIVYVRNMTKIRMNQDIFVFNRDVPQYATESLETLREKNIKTIYDIDDLLEHIESTNYLSSWTENPEAIGWARNLVKGVDLITVSTFLLKEEYEKLTKTPIIVLPNCLDFSEWQERKRAKDSLRIGYVGSGTHTRDILLILEVIRDLKEQYDFTFVLMGITKKWLKGLDTFKENKPWYHDAWEIRKLLDQIPGVECHSGVSIYQYPKKLSELDLDIGLAPLVDSRFNRCKSAIKFYEYCATGTLTLASRVTPYQEEVNLTVKNRYDKWAKALSRLIEDKDLRDKLLSEQRAYVKEKANIEGHGHLWEENYENLLRN